MGVKTLRGMAIPTPTLALPRQGGGEYYFFTTFTAISSSFRALMT